MGQVEASYRIDQSQISGVSYSDDFVEQQVEAGWLIPDTRLQAIADAPRCEHDKIDRHLLAQHWVTVRPAGKAPHLGSVDDWCEGAPELRALLNALTEEVHHRT